MAATPETLNRLKQVVRSTLKLGPDEALDQAMPLVGGEYDLDSLDVLLLITNVEKEFGIKIRDGAIDRSTFASLGTLADFVERARAAA